MKKILRSTFGTLVVAAFLALTPPIYAKGGKGGHGGGHRHGGGHAVGHFRGGKHVKGGKYKYARGARVYARYAGRAYNWNGGRNWNSGYWGGRNWSGGYWNGGSRFIFIGGGYPYYSSWYPSWGWSYPYSYAYYSYYPYWYYPSYGYKYDDCSVSRRRYFYR